MTDETESKLSSVINTISVCMIVKNEENVLARCLDSLKGIYDELIIVDTGSSDNTKNIALKYTDKVFDFQWVNDFSAARNFAFEKASMDYIYSADADEVIDEVNRDRFIELKNNEALKDVEIVQMIYVTESRFNTTENYARDLRPKLYKRLRKLRWIDPVHESVNLDPVIYDSDIEILHLPEGNHSGRDFEVFQKALDNGKELSCKLQRMYARELMIAGEIDDFERAESNFIILSARIPKENEEDINTIAYIILAHLYRLKNETSQFFKYALKNIATKPCSEICMEIATYYYEIGDYDEAIIWCTNAYKETEAVLIADSAFGSPLKMMIACYDKLADINDMSWYKDMADELRKELENG